MINLYNVDCMDFMAGLPDKAFDLAIVDPPYKNEFKIVASDKAAHVKRDFDLRSLNNTVPNDIYFNELRRVSRNQIVWGVNYYPTYLGAGRIVWDKDNTGVYSDCELAFHSFSDVTRKFLFRWNGMIQGDMKYKEQRIHPTQKPVALYRWLLQNYAKPGQKILDTHGGSMSIAIACDIEGFDLDLCELDPDYFQAGKKRLEQHQSQPRMFAPEPPPKPEQLSIDPAA